MSGISVDNAVIDHYNANIKPGSAPGAWMTMKLSDDKTQIVLDQFGNHADTPEGTHAALLATLPSNNCRYAVLSVKSQTSDGVREKIGFVNWAPDTSPIKEKMLIASTGESVKKQLEGVQFHIQATDEEEVAYARFVAEMGRFK
jgi:cofilin